MSRGLPSSMNSGSSTTSAPVHARRHLPLAVRQRGRVRRNHAMTFGRVMTSLRTWWRAADRSCVNAGLRPGSAEGSAALFASLSVR